LRVEQFLGENRCWVRRWVRLRAGASCLEVVAGRRRGVPRDRRLCGWCEGGLVEDELHFLDVCKRWKRERRALWESLRLEDEEVVKGVAGWSSQERVDWLLSGGSPKTRPLLVKLVGSWMAQRERVGCGRQGSGNWGEELSGLTRKRVREVHEGWVKSIAQEVGEATRKRVRRLEKHVVWVREMAGEVWEEAQAAWAVGINASKNKRKR
jgi:hypothetical protein